MPDAHQPPSGRPEPDPESLAERVYADHLARREAGEDEDFEALRSAHPELAPELERVHSGFVRLERVRDELREFDPVHRGAPEEDRGAPPPDALVAEIRQGRALLERLAGRESAEARYRTGDKVNEGGMGAILDAWDEDLRRHVAMKVVREPKPGLPGGTNLGKLRRFLDEARITGQLDHPGIVPVHDLGLTADGRVYFTMKLVEGRDLAAVFELVRSGGEGWTLARALGVLQRVCEAMAYAHDKGVVHRDLKPSNVMVGRFGEVYVMDWGFARVIGEEDARDLGVDVERSRASAGTGSDSHLYTMDGDVVGTPVFMSPEQASGKGSELGPASDVYSVGAMLYQLLSGRLPYVDPGSDVDKLRVVESIRAGPPSPVADVAPGAPPELAAICDRAMAREPGSRYASMEELAGDLRAHLEGRVVSAHGGGAWEELRKWAGRNQGLAASLVAVALLVLTATGLGVRFWVEAGKTEKLAAANERTEAARASEERAKLTALDAQARAEEARADAIVARDAEAAARADAEGAYDAEQRARYSQAVAGLGLALALDDPGWAERIDFSPPEELRNWEWDHLRLKRVRPSAQLAGHESVVRKAQFTRFGLLTCGMDGSARLWDLENGAELRRWNVGTPLLAIAVVESAGLAAVSGNDGSVHVMDLEGGSLRSLDAVDDVSNEIQAIALHPDERTLAIGLKTGSVRLLDIERDAEIAEFQAHSGVVYGVGFARDGAVLATASGTGEVFLWDSESREVLGNWRVPDAVFGLDIRDDGSRIVVGGNGSRLWSIDAEGDGPALAVPGHRAWITAVASHPSRPWIAGAGLDGSVIVFDETNGRVVRSFQGGSDGVYGVSFDELGDRVATATKDTHAYVFDFEEDPGAIVLRGHRYVASCVAFHPDGRLLASAGDDNTVRVWDTYQGVGLRTLPVHGNRVQDVAWTRDGDTVVSGSSDGTLHLWSRSAAEGQVVWAGGEVDGVAVHPDGETIYFVTRSGTLGELFLGDEEPDVVVDFDSKGRSVDVSPDGTRALVGTHDGKVILVDLNDRAVEREWALADLRAGGRQDISKVRFLAPGDRFVAASWDGFARIVDLREPDAEPVVLDGRVAEVHSLAVSPDGSRIVTGSSASAEAQLWDAETGTLLLTLRGHDTAVFGLAFDATGTRIASASGDHTVRVWESERPKEVIAARRDARRLTAKYAEYVEELFIELVYMDEVEAAIEAADLPAEDRDAALRLTRCRGDDNQWWAARLLGVVGFALPEAEHERTLKMAKALIEHAPKYRLYQVLHAGVLHRVGRSAEAIDRLLLGFEGREVDPKSSNDVLASGLLSLALLAEGRDAEAGKWIPIYRDLASRAYNIGSAAIGPMLEEIDRITGKN